MMESYLTQADVLTGVGRWRNAISFGRALAIEPQHYGALCARPWLLERIQHVPGVTTESEHSGPTGESGLRERLEEVLRKR